MDQFFGNVPELSSDTVDYEIYPLDGQSTDSQHEITIESIYKAVEKWTNGYIWNCQGFQLEKSNDPCKNCLNGSTQFEKALDDEMFIVWLLLRISEKFPVAIVVREGKTEFLLATFDADLPDWVGLNSTRNRVFLYQGKLHLIPPPTIPSQLGKLPVVGMDEHGELNGLELRQGLACLERYPMLTEAEEELQKGFQESMKEFGTDLRLSQHSAKVLVPRKVAEVLSLNPLMITHAVKAFNTRDTHSLNVITKMSTFNPSTLISCTIKFHKHQYVDLLSDSFYPPKLFLHAQPKRDSKDYAAWLLGAKVACGMEMVHKENPELFQDLLDRVVPDKEINQGETDSEEWLDVKLEDLNEPMSKFTEKDFEKDDSDDEDEAEEINAVNGLIKGVKELMEGSSGLEGIGQGPIKFDPDRFEAILMQQIGASEESEESSEDEEDEPMEQGERVEKLRREVEEMEKTMAEMDAVLSQEPKLNSFEKDDDAPINLDLNLVKNLLESFQAQNGDVGPLTGILGHLGIK